VGIVTVFAPKVKPSVKMQCALQELAKMMQGNMQKCEIMGEILQKQGVFTYFVHIV
jgi:hypothetical protein